MRVPDAGTKSMSDLAGPIAPEAVVRFASDMLVVALKKASSPAGSCISDCNSSTGPDVSLKLNAVFRLRGAVELSLVQFSLAQAPKRCRLEARHTRQRLCKGSDWI